MIYNIYAIKDIKASYFMTIWTETNDDTAIRNYDTIRKDTNTLIGQYPGDFELWTLGTFNMKTGEIIPEMKFIKGGELLEVRK